MSRVLVGMSGGVDSSVAAYLLREQGHDVIGVTMLLHTGQGDPARQNTCCSLDDVEDARSVARRIGIPHYAFDFTDEFEKSVVDYFVDAYETGLTPNPCAVCNRRIKFGALLRRARELGCDCVATGHYARIEAVYGPDGAPRRHVLRKAVDAAKDQSYFLALLDQDQLAHALLPLGGFSKPQVRAVAEEQGFVTARKRESQDVCFVPDGDYLAFLEQRRGGPYPCGPIVTEDGRTVGTHRGAPGYTIGQRKGLGVALGEPVYVAGKDMAANTVTVGPAQSLMSPSCTVAGWNWIGEPSGAPIRVTARTHYRQKESPATLAVLPDGRIRLDFDEPQRAVTPGQVAVAFDGDHVVGGGFIAS